MEESLKLPRIIKHLAHGEELGLIHEEPLDTYTRECLAQVVDLALREREGRISKHQHHLSHTGKQMANSRIMRMPMHGIHMLLTQGGLTTSLQAISNDLEVDFLLDIMRIDHALLLGISNYNIKLHGRRIDSKVLFVGKIAHAEIEFRPPYTVGEIDGLRIEDPFVGRRQLFDMQDIG